jgi:O-antigen/teichoic acid export membrane protein
MGALLFLQTGLIIINANFSVFEAGLYSIALVISTQIRSIGFIASSLYQPKLITLISKNDLKAANEHLNRSILAISIIASLVTGLFIGSAEYVFKYWVDTESKSLVNISILLTIYLPFTLGMGPAWAFLMAHKKVKQLGCITLLLGAGNVLLALLLIEFTDLGVYSVVISSMTLLLFQNLIVVPLILKRHQVLIFQIYKGYLVTGSYLLVTIFITHTIFHLFPSQSITYVLVNLFGALALILGITLSFLVLKYKTMNVQLLLKKVS